MFFFQIDKIVFRIRNFKIIISINSKFQFQRPKSSLDSKLLCRRIIISIVLRKIYNT